MKTMSLTRNWLSDAHLLVFILLTSSTWSLVSAQTLKPDFDVPSLCEGVPIQFTNTSVYDTSLDVKFFWMTGDLTDTVEHPIFTFPVMGATRIRNVNLRIINGNDTAEITKATTIISFPQADFYWDSACSETPTHFITNGNYSIGHANRMRWQFTSSEDTVGYNPYFLFDSVGSYNVKFVLDFGGICKDSISKQVDVLPQARAQYTPIACLCQPLSFQDQTTIDPPYTFTSSWTIPESARDTACNGWTPGEHEVIFEVFTLGGCASRRVDTLQTRSLPNADFRVQERGLGTGYFIFDVTALDDSAEIYQWSSPNGIAAGNEVSVTETYDFGDVLYNGFHEISLAVKKDGCWNDAVDSVEVYLPVPERQRNPLKIYPNPTFSTNFMVEIQGSLSANAVELTDIHGQKIPFQIFPVAANIYRIECNDLLPGLYHIRIIGQSNLNSGLLFFK